MSLAAASGSKEIDLKDKSEVAQVTDTAGRENKKKKLNEHKKKKRSKDPKAAPAPADSKKSTPKKRKRAKEEEAAAAGEGGEKKVYAAKAGLDDPQGTFDGMLALDGAVDMQLYHTLIKHCAKTSDMSAAVYLWHKMTDAGLEHGPEEYKLLHPLHGKKMEDSKKLKKVPALPEWVKSTKREIHEILTNQQLAPKKERASDKLPIVISELLKIEDTGWARVFESSSALAQFLARRCKLKESQSRPLVSILRDGELFTMLGATKEGKPKPGEPPNKKIRIASREKLIQCAKALSFAAKEVGKDEDVDADKRKQAKETARLLRIEICQGVQEVKDQKKKEKEAAEKPWEAARRKAGGAAGEDDKEVPHSDNSDSDDSEDDKDDEAEKPRKAQEAEKPRKAQKKQKVADDESPEPKKKKAKKQQQQPADDKEDAADKPAKKKAVKKKQQQSDDPSAEKKKAKKKHKVAADADDEYTQPAADNEKPERQKKFKDGKKLDEEAAREYDVDRTEDENAAAMAAFDAL